MYLKVTMSLLVKWHVHVPLSTPSRFSCSIGFVSMLAVCECAGAYAMEISHVRHLLVLAQSQQLCLCLMLSGGACVHVYFCDICRHFGFLFLSLLSVMPIAAFDVYCCPLPICNTCCPLSSVLSHAAMTVVSLFPLAVSAVPAVYRSLHYTRSA